MPDPHVLYGVTAVVVTGLVAWVAVVLARPDAAPVATPSPGGGAADDAREQPGRGGEPMR